MGGPGPAGRPGRDVDDARAEAPTPPRWHGEPICHLLARTPGKAGTLEQLGRAEGFPVSAR